MFMNIRRYRISPGQRDEVVRRVDEGRQPRARLHSKRPVLVISPKA
jgi:hypothetical protein